MIFIRAFWVGGVLCAAAQILIDRTKLTPVRILVLYVTAGVFLTGAGVYEPIVRYAGAGALTPLTGFGYVLAKGAEKAIDRHGVLGIFSGGLSGASAGITAAVVFGCVVAVFFRTGRK